jgi:predicted PurR-regulated permease PerM
MDNPSNRLVIYLVALASIFVVMFGIRGTASIINPILLASVITIAVLPIPGKLTKRGLPGWLALVLTILAVVLLLALVMATVFFSVTQLSIALPTYMADGATTAPAETTDSETAASTTEVTIQFGPMFQSIMTSVLDMLVQFGIALAIFFFMISAAMSLPSAVRLGLDPRAQIIGRVTKLTEDVRHYLTILTGINLLVGLGDTIFLMYLGVDFAVLWGLLAWFMGYIPSIGFMIALVPPMLMAYAQYGLNTALVVLVGYILINGGVQNFIQPKIMGQGLRINPVVVFVGLFIWGYLLGGIGALLAVPLTLLVLTIMENFEGSRMLAVLMRYTSADEDKQEEHLKAVKDVQSLWEKTKRVIVPQQVPKEEPKAKAKTKTKTK